MIEVVIRKYLMETLGVPVYLEYPENPEDEFIVMEKTGGTENHIYTAMMAVQSYGESLYDAAVLNGKAISAMLEMAKLNEICKVSLNSDYNFTDTRQKKYRYQAVFDIVYY